jgi:hypothetical protein
MRVPFASRAMTTPATGVECRLGAGPEMRCLGHSFAGPVASAKYDLADSNCSNGSRRLLERVHRDVRGIL